MMRGLSMDALCARMGGRVTKQSVSKYENGLMRPDAEVLRSLAEALGVSVASFESAGGFSVRGIVPLDAETKLPERLSERCAAMLSRYLELLSMLGLSAKYRNPLAGMCVSDESSAAVCAVKLREKWQIPEGLPDAQVLLESHGIYVLEASFPFDACAALADGKHLSVLLESSLPVEEKRLVTLREAGRHMLGFVPSLPRKRIDALCALFARELLISSEAMVKLVGYSRDEISLRELRDVQAGYGLSVDTLMDRALDENIITCSKYSLYRRRKRSDPAFRRAVEQSLQPPSSGTRLRTLVDKALSLGLIDRDKAGEYLAGEPVEEDVFI